MKTTTRIERDILQVVKTLIGEQQEAQPRSAVWRLATIAVELEEKALNKKLSTDERIARRHEILDKINPVIIYPL